MGKERAGFEPAHSFYSIRRYSTCLVFTVLAISSHAGSHAIYSRAEEKWILESYYLKTSEKSPWYAPR
jgi:hypothetical protein